MPSRNGSPPSAILPHGRHSVPPREILERRKRKDKTFPGVAGLYWANRKDGDPLLTQNRAIVLLLSAFAASCHRGGSGSGGGGPFRAIDVDAPFGLEGPAVSKCNGDGYKFTPAATYAALSDATPVHSAPDGPASCGPG